MLQKLVYDALPVIAGRYAWLALFLLRLVFAATASGNKRLAAVGGIYDATCPPLLPTCGSDFLRCFPHTFGSSDESEKACTDYILLEESI